MDIKELILAKIKQNKSIKTGEIMKATGFSRAYLNPFLQDLRDLGQIVLLGKGRGAQYVLADKKALQDVKQKILHFSTTIKNEHLSEDDILQKIKQETGLFMNLKENVNTILYYGFTEMLNNAIDHSQSKEIKIIFKKENDIIQFQIIDHGIGIYNNIQKKRNLNNRTEAIQELLKGKQTTAPKNHTGQGIFFTSKIADSLIIASSDKKLIFNNLVDDVFIQDIVDKKGTTVIFSIHAESDTDTEKIFSEYEGDNYEFSKTKVAVYLYKMGDIYISRSQARRIMLNLEKFKDVILDFKHIKTVGQSFADEIFRVWSNYHPSTKITTINTNENIDIMINKARGDNN